MFAQGGSSAVPPQEAFHRDAGDSDWSRLEAVPRFHSLGDMLQSVHPNLVDVVTSEAEHVGVALKSLEAGAHVIVEKPVAFDLDDLRRLGGAAKLHGRFVFPAHVLRFDARYVAVREKLRRAKGSLRFLSTQRNFQEQAHGVYGRVHPAFNALIHDIDLAIWFTGSEPDRVLGYARGNDSDLGTPRVLVALLEWTDGPSALLENAWHLVNGISVGYEFRCIVMHEGFTAVVAPGDEVSVYEPDGIATFPDTHLWPSMPWGVSGALRSELMHFASCALEDRQSDIVDITDAERAIRVARAIVKSLQEDSWIEPSIG